MEPMQMMPPTLVINVTKLVKNVQELLIMNVLNVNPQDLSIMVNVLKAAQLITTPPTEFVILVMPNVLNVMTEEKNNVKNVTQDST